MKKRALLLILSLCLGVIPLAPAFQNWEGTRQPTPGSEPANSILPHPLDSEKILLASSARLFEVSKNKPKEKTGRVYLPQSGIRKILFFKQVPESIFLLTERGIFKMPLKNGDPELIFRNPKAPGQASLVFAVNPGNPRHYFAGTAEGLFESDDAGKTWFPFYRFKRKAVSLLRFSGTRLFAASGNELLVSEDMSFFRSSFFLRESAFDETESSWEETEEEPLSGASGFHELISSEDNSRLWLATREGLFRSIDAGKSWRAMPGAGLREKAVFHLAYSEPEKTVFAAGPKSVYRFIDKENRWTEIFTASKINGLALIGNSDSVLYVLSDQGVSTLPHFPGDLENPGLDIPAVWKLDLFRGLTSLEPSITQFQKSVIDYNNVKNSKIKRWHAESRICSFLPSLSFGKDFSAGNNIDIDRGGTSDRDQFISGPEDISRGWDFDVSWDLGDFIWSSNQTSIDSREKLMIELRNDLLAESTRIFYERRRLQMEAALQPAASQEEFMEKLLAIDELTALLDGMSGGFLIKKLELLYREHPEFEKLWEYDSYSVARTAHGEKVSNDKKL